ncbi:MAG: DUF427 domain-containing protein [Pseudomonadota bacterium]
MTDTTIYNPANNAHYMRLKPIKATVEVRAGGSILGRSDRAIRLIEVGKDIYDPVVYLPLEDTTDALQSMGDKSTHCPLKGNAHYFSLSGETQPVAWVYDEPLPFAKAIGGYAAFYADKVTLVEIGQNDSTDR